MSWDGVDIRELDPHSVGDRIMMVLQDPIRWPHTARANVRAGRHDRDDPGDLALRAAAELAGADTVVADLPHGWQTLLSKYFRGGRELSGGQWQRLAVARGVFRDAPVLIWTSRPRRWTPRPSSRCTSRCAAWPPAGSSF